MKVAALLLDYPPHRWIGSEVATHQLLRHLAGRGHDVDVWVTSNEALEDWNHEGIRVHWDYSYRTYRPDVMVTHYELGKRAGRVEAPLVGITHNARVPKALDAASWALLVHNAEWTVPLFAPHRQCPYIVVPPPVDPNQWQQRTGDAVTMVNVTAEKGSNLFWRVAAASPHRQFIAVIGGWGEPDVRDLPNVEVIDHTDDMRSVYCRTRVLLMPSRHESWGRAAVEAMASRVPVIASDLPGLAESVAAGGFLVDADDFAGWMAALDRLDDTAAYTEASDRAAARAAELDPLPSLDLFADCVEAIAAGCRGPWRTDGIRSWRHRTTGRVVTINERAPLAARYQARTETWEELPA